MIGAIQHAASNDIQLLTFYLGNQCFGVDILSIENIIQRGQTTRVPLAAPYVSGMLNLRGHVVTEIDVGKVLDVERSIPIEQAEYAAIVHHREQRYSLVFDRMAEIIRIQSEEVTSLPETIDDTWYTLTQGVYRQQGVLVTLLNVHAIIDHLIAQIETEWSAVSLQQWGQS